MPARRRPSRPSAPKPVTKTKAPKKKAATAKKPPTVGRRGVVVGVGLGTVDMMCVAPRLDDRLVELGVFSMQGGGNTANTVAALAMIGARTRFFGRIGDDDFGRFIRAGLDELGVDTSMVVPEPRKISAVSMVQIDEFTRKRKILFTRGSTSALTPRDLPQKLLHGASLLCLDGYQPALQAAIAEKAREKGIPVLLNAGHLTGGMGELLALADVVIGSESFATEFAPSDDIETSLREITRLGPRIAVITLGADGAVGLEGTKVVQQDPLDVFVADTTGAGDVFSGAFAYGYLAGWPLERSMPFANAAAGLSCRSVGARAGLPTLAEIEDAIRDRTT